MSKEQDKLIDYIVVCINDFGDKHRLRYSESYKYLFQYGGLDFIKEFYDVEHLLPQQEVLEDLSAICRQHGGSLA